ncbi:MAG: beta-xylosidase [Bacteroidaceae bacterium]|nr:beta-xylosidase [Bacteroidaceae bacterium]
MKRYFFIAFFIVLVLPQKKLMAQNAVQITVDAQQTIEPMKHIWAWVGYDEPNYTYMTNGKKLLSELAAMSPVPVYVRTHNLLTTGDGSAALKWGSTNAYTETKRGKPIYNWVIMDSIVDAIVSRGMKPLMEIGFMPEALSTHPVPYRHHWRPGEPYDDIYTGWTFPPKDYNKWRELIEQWVRHSVERYGKEEVESWYWEVWNEPNIGYWSGTHEEYCKLYDYAADGLKRALPTARIGGPETTDPTNKYAAEYLRKFLEHCLYGKNYATGKVGAPLEYISFHAKGNPRVVNGHVQMNMGHQLANIDKGFEIVASFPELRTVPIVIGESDPEGCAACSVEFNPQNGYRDGTMYSSYTAASFARKYELARKHGVNFIGAVSWSFEYEGEPMFSGFRELASGGIDKPVLNVMRMFGMMSGNIAQVTSTAQIPMNKILGESVRDEADVHGFATVDEHSITVMVWNYHDADVKNDTCLVNLQIKGVPQEKVLVCHYRIDDDFSNAYEVFKQMGAPQSPTAEQYATLERCGQLQLLTSPSWKNVSEHVLPLQFSLPRQGVSLVKIAW